MMDKNSSQPSLNVVEKNKLENYQKQFLIKKLVKFTEPELKIESVDFSMFSDSDIKQFSHVEIFVPEIYENTSERNFNDFGPLDLRLGTSLKANLCKTCGRDLAECVGHFGHITLPLPVYHVGYFKETLRVYRSVCKTCSRLLLTDEEKAILEKKMIRAKTLGKTQAKLLTKEVTNNHCSKVSNCPHCGAVNGSAIKAPKYYGIMHRKYKNKKHKKEEEAEMEEFKTATDANPSLKKYIEQGGHDPDPLTVYKLFKNIPSDDLYLLNIKGNRPEDMLVTSLLVPPSCTRPTVKVDDTRSQEDDLTVKLREIVKISNTIKENMSKGSMPSSIREHWVLLQSEVARYINSDMTGFPKTGPKKKQMRSLVQRLIGKQGRFRGNLSGKRVDFSGRTVISPDPNVEVNQVVLPRKIAQILTYPETANQHNIETLRKCVENGPQKYPGANFVLFKKDNLKQFLKYGDRKATAKSLKLGDVVERHILDNDVILFNRQPSLHKMSIMAHRVVVMEWRTLRFNVCVCNPYNADFDGDEMNIHVPQTEEARAEAANLMGVTNNFVTPKCGEPLIVPIQDFLTASYLLTSKDVFYQKEDFMQNCSYFTSECGRVVLRGPAVLKPICLWTGKQVMSTLFKPNESREWPDINIEVPAKHYPRKPPDAQYPREYYDPLDRFVLIRRSELLSGRFDKSILGSTKHGLFAFLLNVEGSAVTAKVMGRLSKLCARWLGEHGFSIGIDDVTPSEELTAAKRALMDEGYRSCSQFEKEYQSGNLKPQPGCTKLETLEAKMLGKLSDIREDSGRRCIESLSMHNSPIIMATCGSKGSTINIAQMVACVGQQALQSGRIPEGFVNRTLPHFRSFSRSPEAKGFVRNSFFTGLSATEFFFHTMAGREGLIDTAVKTAETGYMQRRLMKALEDGCAQYDDTVRNCENVVLQFSYGEDGLDPVVSDQASPKALRVILRQTMNKPANKAAAKILPSEIKAAFRRFLEKLRKKNFPKFEDFSKKSSDVVENFVSDLEKVRRKLKLGDTIQPDSQKERFWGRNFGLSAKGLEEFLDKSYEAFRLALVEPGSAVGAMGAQSIGEPSTQMTLKTFHFAGVASMNITLGVPRIKEIINAIAKIKTPIINAALDCVDSEQVARIVKGRLEITTLGGISKYIRQFICNDFAFIEILIDRNTVTNLMLEIDSRSVKDSILRHKKLGLKEKSIATLGQFKLRITSPDTKRNTLLFSLERIALLLPKVQVRGIENIHRAVIRRPDPLKYRWEYRYLSKNGRERWRVFPAIADAEIESLYGAGEKIARVDLNAIKRAQIWFGSNAECFKGMLFPSRRSVWVRRRDVDYELTVEGPHFSKVMTTSGVDGTRTTTNLIPDVAQVLGIEAAREAIVRELLFTFSVHGLTVDVRHIKLLAEVMTFKGEVLGITRFGIAKMKDSVLMQASFETPMDHLFSAAVEGATDPIKGVSECIILGTPMPIGSGTFQLLRKVDRFEGEDVKSIFG